jgi:hypothetical protein
MSRKLLIAGFFIFLTTNLYAQGYKKQTQFTGTKPSVSDKNLGALNFISRSGETGYKLYVNGASSSNTFIDGRNHTLTGGLVGSGNKAGIQTDLAQSTITNSNVTIYGNPPKKGNWNTDISVLEWLNYFKHVADYTITQDTTWQSKTIGSPNSYKVVYVDNAKLTLGTDFTGYGILAIYDRSPNKTEPILQMLSNAKWYGLILVYQGDNESTSDEVTYIKLNGQAPLDIKDFVIVAEESCLLKRRVRINSGDVCVNNDKKILTTENYVITHGSLYADTLTLGSYNTIYEDIGYNHLTYGSNLRVYGNKITPISLPLLGLPQFPFFTRGTKNINVGNYQTYYLKPGKYKNITLGTGATLYLTGGTYDVRQITARDSAKIRYLAPVTLRIKRKLIMGSYARIEPYSVFVPGPGPGPGPGPIPFLLFPFFIIKSAEAKPLPPLQPILEADDCVIYIQGVGQSATTPIFQTGYRSVIKCNIYAKDKIKLGTYNTFQGAMIARHVEIGYSTSLSLKSAFGTVYVYGSVLLGGRLFHIPYGGGNTKIYYSRQALQNVDSMIQNKPFVFKGWREEESQQ